MNPDTSPGSRGRLLVIAAVIVGALAIAAWALLTPADTRSTAEAPAETAPATSPGADAPASRAGDPPTVMPDGSAIPSPSPGSPPEIGEGRVEETTPVPVRSPVPLDEAADFGTGLTVELADIAPVQGVARTSGEVAGPAVEVTVQAVNDSSDAVPLDGVVVFLSYGTDRIPASAFSQGTTPLAGTLAGGSSATGTYVFAVPEDQRDDVRIEISYTGEAPTVAFTGAID